MASPPHTDSFTHERRQLEIRGTCRKEQRDKRENLDEGEKRGLVERASSLIICSSVSCARLCMLLGEWLPVGS